MITFLVLVVISFVISILLSPLILRRIFRKAGFDVDFWNALGLFRWLSGKISKDKRHPAPNVGKLTFQPEFMTSVLGKDVSKKRERFADKLFHPENTNV
jgi:hypothetical protein